MKNEWIDAEYYRSGACATIANDDGHLLLFVSFDLNHDPTTIVAMIRDGAFCDCTGEPLRYESPEYLPIAVTELPKPRMGPHNMYDVKTGTSK